MGIDCCLWRPVGLRNGVVEETSLSLARIHVCQTRSWKNVCHSDQKQTICFVCVIKSGKTWDDPTWSSLPVKTWRCNSRKMGRPSSRQFSPCQQPPPPTLQYEARSWLKYLFPYRWNASWRKSPGDVPERACIHISGGCKACGEGPFSVWINSSCSSDIRHSQKLRWDSDPPSFSDE